MWLAVEIALWGAALVRFLLAVHPWPPDAFFIARDSLWDIFSGPVLLESR